MGFLIRVDPRHQAGVFRRAGFVFTTKPQFLERLPKELRAELSLPHTPLIMERAKRAPEDSEEDALDEAVERAAEEEAEESESDSEGL